MPIVGVDIGGTFTDALLYDERVGKLSVAKTPTTYPEFSEGVINVIGKTGVSLGDVDRFIGVGSTLAENALIERKLPKTALITTKGFRDLLQVGRWWRGRLFDLQWDKPAQFKPIVRRRDIFEVTERIASDGRIIMPLDEKEARNTARAIRDGDYQAVAIFFINSYVNPIHEEIMARLLGEEAPRAFITTSTSLSRIIREHGRLHTCVFNACLMPLLVDFIERLTNGLRQRGFKGSLFFFQSNGGITDPTVVRKKPVLTIGSGPAAGVSAARYLATFLGHSNVITLDMGGTTVKCCAMADLSFPITTEYIFEWDMPLALPMVDMVELGAGGGSIAWVDKGGRLRVGPQSAGSRPGPACYGMGGLLPTLTDANLVLGRLNPRRKLADEIALRSELAKNAIISHISEPLGTDVEEAAFRIVRLAETIMSQAVRSATIERGIDPRDYVMYAFGGAGPMHAATLCEELQIPQVIIPPYPGAFSALGMCVTDFSTEFAVSVLYELGSIDPDVLTRSFEQLERRLSQELAAYVGKKSTDFTIMRTATIKYIGEPIGKGLDVGVPMKSLTQEDLRDIRRRFDELHYARYGFMAPEERAVIVDIRSRVTAVSDKVPLRPFDALGAGRAIPKERRDVFFEAGYVSTRVYARENLKGGTRIEGPAIIEEETSTLVIPPEFDAYVGAYGEIIIQRT